jgi:hypothetical protein
VTSIFEEYDLVFASCLKSAAVDNELLAPLLLENALVPASREIEKVKIDKDVLTNASIARVAAMGFAEVEDVHTGDAICAMLHARHGVLVVMDRTLKVEEAFFASMNGKAGTEQLRTAILATLPIAACPKSLDESVQLLGNIGKSALLAYCGAGPSGAFKIVRSWLVTMQSGRAPAFTEAASSAFIDAVKARLAYFCRNEASSGSDAAALTGKAALYSMFSKAKAKFAKDPKALTLEDVHPFVIYRWLLDKTKWQQVQEWTDGVMASCGISLKVDTPLAKMSSEKEGKALKVGDAESVVDSYFS